MKVFFYLLAACVLGLAAYRLGVSRTVASYRDISAIEMYDYQVRMTSDTAWVYNHGKSMGWYLINRKCGLDSVIINNNK